MKFLKHLYSIETFLLAKITIRVHLNVKLLTVQLMQTGKVLIK